MLELHFLISNLFVHFFDLQSVFQLQVFQYLYYHFCIYIYAIATIDDPPVNKTVCRDSDVTISCGYSWFVTPVTWIINGTSFTQSAILNNPSYQQNNLNRPSSYSLDVYSINDTTTFQCIVHSDPDVTSTQGIVTVIGTYVRY